MSEEILLGLLEMQPWDKRAQRDYPLYRQLYEQLRGLILSGRLHTGQRLPASRVLARGLSLSRNTVQAAYSQLQMEGYIEARAGAGNFVAEQGASEAFGEGQAFAKRGAKPGAAHKTHKLSRRGKILADSVELYHASNRAKSARNERREQAPFAAGQTDLTLFPHEQWARALRRASRVLGAQQRSGGGVQYDHYNVAPLQQALAHLLRERRGVQAQAEQIMILPSVQAGLDLAARALIDEGDKIWLETPCYVRSRIILEASGADLVPLEIDDPDLKENISRLPAPKLIFLTPSYQYPTGRLMPLALRLAFLEKAQQEGGYIFEDDYNSEFHYAGRPIPALQGVDETERVIYSGTFSQIFSSEIRISYLVAPKGLVAPLQAIQRNCGAMVSTVLQLALAGFIEDGYYRSHLRTMRRLYAARRAALVEVIEEQIEGALKGRVEIVGDAGGLQVVIRFLCAGYEDKVRRKLAGAGINASPLSAYYWGDAAHSEGLVLGFSAWSDEVLRKKAHELGRELVDILTSLPRPQKRAGKI